MLQAEAAIDEVIERHRKTKETLAVSSNQLWEINSGIQSDIDGALVALQFQDRVGQILNHVESNLQQFTEQVQDPSQLQSAQWLNRLKSEVQHVGGAVCAQ